MIRQTNSEIFLDARHVVEVGLVRTVVGGNCCLMRLTYVGGYLQFFAAEFLPAAELSPSKYEMGSSLSIIYGRPARHAATVSFSLSSRVCFRTASPNHKASDNFAKLPTVLSTLTPSSTDQQYRVDLAPLLSNKAHNRLSKCCVNLLGRRILYVANKFSCTL